MDIQKTINYWLEGAISDMNAAEVLFKEKQYSQCLFWCHLALEKILKAHVVKMTQGQAAYIHNLVLLAEKAELPFSEEQKNNLSEISQFNLMGRYPDEMMAFANKCSPEFSEQYFLITKNLYQWLLDRMSSR